MYSNNHYNKTLKSYARELRTESVSKAEKFMWKVLLQKRKTGQRFLRQRPIDNFIVDFFCPELKLIIEIDGNSHVDRGSYDSCRQRKLESLGYTFIRFEEGYVLNQIDEVNTKLTHAIYCLVEKPD